MKGYDPKTVTRNRQAEENAFHMRSRLTLMETLYNRVDSYLGFKIRNLSITGPKLRSLGFEEKAEEDQG